MNNKQPDSGESIVQPDDPFAHCLRKRVTKQEAIRRWGKAARGYLEILTDEGLWSPLHDFNLNFVGYGLAMPDAKPFRLDKKSLLDLRTNKTVLTVAKPTLADALNFLPRRNTNKDSE